MASEKQGITYRRQGSVGTLQLHGVLDIFEAETLHTTALRCLKDDKAETIQIKLAQAERLDLSTLQILLAMKRDLATAGRACGADEAPTTIQKTLTTLGLSL